jgi:hypothetical protein
MSMIIRFASPRIASPTLRRLGAGGSMAVDMGCGPLI